MKNKILQNKILYSSSISFNSEQDIFSFLKLEYILPKERNTCVLKYITNQLKESQLKENK